MSEEVKQTIPFNAWLSMPAVKLAGALVAVAVIGWKANAFVTQILTANEKVGDKVERVIDKVDLIRTELKAEIANRTSDRYTRTDHRFWAYDLEKLNGGKIIVPPTPQPNNNP